MWLHLIDFILWEEFKKKKKKKADWYFTSKSSAVTLKVVFYVKQQENITYHVKLQGYKKNCWSTFSPLSINLNNLLTNQAILFN